VGFKLILLSVMSKASSSSPEAKCYYHGKMEKIGLYDPDLEKDACGVGMVANLSAEPTHEIVRNGIEILERMAHRGACGCDEASGDGSGLLMAVPDAFFRRDLRQNHGVELPVSGKYACGCIFLPQDFTQRQQAKRHIEEIIEKHSQTFIAWRRVPTNNQQLGKESRESEPCIEQVFIECADGLQEKAFDLVLYVIRRQMTSTYRGPGKIYCCSLSSKTIVYKGQLTPEQVNNYFIDLGQRDFMSHFTLAHSRFSTNTFPSWERAQPLRCLAHNGEINTLQGNKNWMLARQGNMKSNELGSLLQEIFPVIEADNSDSGCFDNVLELLYHSGRSIEESVLMMVPEPWQKHADMAEEKRAFYEYHSHLLEPWDGPAFVGFTDGNVAGAVLDRNGLRPGRFWVTSKGKVVLASEVGVLPEIPDEDIVQKGRLTPGEMFLIDFTQKRIVLDKEIKQRLATSQPYGEWLKTHEILVDNSEERKMRKAAEADDVQAEEQEPMLPTLTLLKMFGYTVETLEILLGPMVNNAYEALGSMGNDMALACLSAQPRRIFDYFQQRFAQVTNPPIDPIRESIVMSLRCPIGPEQNLLESTEQHCQRVVLAEPILGPTTFWNLCNLEQPGWKPATLDMTWMKAEGAKGLQPALARLCAQSEEAISNNAKIIVLSDKFANESKVAIPSLLAVGAVHQFLVKKGLRARVGIVVECGDACEVHHHCLLVGFGVDGVYPYMVYEAGQKLQEQVSAQDRLSLSDIVDNYAQASNKGMLKVLAKMGISTVQSYKGAQIFEAVGVGAEVMEMCFTGCASRIGGGGFEVFAVDQLAFHEKAFPSKYDTDVANRVLHNPGEYHWRNGGRSEVHLNHPDAIAKLQDAARTNSRKSYAAFAQLTNSLNRMCTLRGQLDLKSGLNPIPLEMVEPAKDIVKRFSTGAMSYGSISIEAHSTLAIAMNRLGGRSNTGEGGEHISRYEPAPDGNSARSAIKQVASGRFGVSIHYLTNSDEIQIKMAQGAKPGEGGELPGHKVVGEIANTRNSTPGVGLISPPPHHDIYSIEDLAQLISDLKHANPSARLSVKLVSEVGVGVIAAGVAKGKADHILISGHDGGTGASKWTGIKHAGLPWELGIAEAHQTLVKNGLRGRVCLQTDGQLKTGLDIIKAALLGAEEFCLATAPLIAMGCIMMRKCHLNTCPVGIATQDPELRRKFMGQPEHVMNYLFLMAEEIRMYMAALGIASFDKLVGRADLLQPIKQNRVKTMGLDLSAMLVPAAILNPHSPNICVEDQDHGLENHLDRQIIKRIGNELKHGKKVRADFRVQNIDRTVGTILSHEVTRAFGKEGLPDNTIHLRFKGSAGQTFGGFLAPGITLELNGDANDYVGKGLSGGNLIIYPPKDSNFKSHKNEIVGNVILYGAISGTAFFSGRASQRFCVRNSGARAVVEGVGDHGCEYMTGGVCVILGSIGRNFAAGMSGGIAYIYDKKNQCQTNVNLGLVQLEAVEEKADVALLRELIDQHRSLTGSAVADKILWNWETAIKQFVKVIPTDYKRVLEQKKAALQAAEIARVAAEEQPKAEPAMAKQEAKDIEDLKVSQPERPTIVNKPIKKRGFIEYDRLDAAYRDPAKRAQDFKEIYVKPSVDHLKTQAARCMDCGVPFCHQETTGCPLGNKIPEWNDLVYQGKWKEALERLLETNNFPEFTGRVCPAPCEGSCVLGIIENPVTIKNIECAIIDKGFENGWIVPRPPAKRTGKKVAVIGSGPAGLAAADQLNKAGHLVTVYERADRIGGLLMYGVPNMKLDKKLIVDRRVDLMRSEGIEFVTNCNVGVDVSSKQLESEFDSVILATGATRARGFPIPGGDLKGIEFAMEYLQYNTKSYLDSQFRDNKAINAHGKRVIVIGGGDTGNDCIGTAVRQGAKSVVNFELLPKPSKGRAAGNPWPEWPRIFRVDYGHKEVQEKYGEDPRLFSVMSKRFLDDGSGNVNGVETVQIQWTKDTQGRWRMEEIEGSNQTYKADLIFLAMGFLGPETTVSDELDVELDKRGNFKADYGKYTTSKAGVFACGDCRRGQSLVVWGISEGRQCAREVDKYLTGSSTLP